MRWTAMLLGLLALASCSNESEMRDPARDLTCPGPTQTTFRDGDSGFPTPEEALGPRDIPDSTRVTREPSEGGTETVTFRAYDLEGELRRVVVVENGDVGWIASRIDDCE